MYLPKLGSLQTVMNYVGEPGQISRKFNLWMVVAEARLGHSESSYARR